jgi:hypothetical protein
VLFVFAIGGSDQNGDPYTLCTDRGTYPNVVCVGLANPDDSAGTVNADTSTDVSAPGNAGVPSAIGTRGEFGYTSGATAHVTGAAALLRGLAPNLSPSTIREVLVSTSRSVAGYETANKAHGIINLEAAVRSVQQMEGLTTPAPGHGAPVDSPDPFAGQTASDKGTAPVNPPAAVKKPKPRLAFTGKLSQSVSAGATLKLHLHVTGAAGTVKATLTHGKATLAKATQRRASGNVTLKLHLHRKAKRGPAKLAVQIGRDKALVRTITVTRPH